MLLWKELETQTPRAPEETLASWLVLLNERQPQASYPPLSMAQAPGPTPLHGLWPSSLGQPV